MMVNMCRNMVLALMLVFVANSAGMMLKNCGKIYYTGFTPKFVYLKKLVPDTLSTPLIEFLV